MDHPAESWWFFFFFETYIVDGFLCLFPNPSFQWNRTCCFLGLPKSQPTHFLAFSFLLFVVSFLCMPASPGSTSQLLPMSPVTLQADDSSRSFLRKITPQELPYKSTPDEFSPMVVILVRRSFGKASGSQTILCRRVAYVFFWAGHICQCVHTWRLEICRGVFCSHLPLHFLWGKF